MRISDWSLDVCSSDLVVTDYTSINEMVPHGYSKDLKQAGEQAINAGVDRDMQGAVYMENLAKSVTEGKDDMKKIDAAVKAILEMKYRLDRKSTRLNSSHECAYRMPSSA